MIRKNYKLNWTSITNEANTGRTFVKEGNGTSTNMSKPDYPHRFTNIIHFFQPLFFPTIKQRAFLTVFKVA